MNPPVVVMMHNVVNNIIATSVIVMKLQILQEHYQLTLLLRFTMSNVILNAVNLK